VLATATIADAVQAGPPDVWQQLQRLCKPAQTKKSKGASAAGNGKQKADSQAVAAVAQVLKEIQL
jgi:hypothetical protein